MRPFLLIFQAPTRHPTTKPTRSPSARSTDCGPSVRRAWHDLNCTDRTAYLQALEMLYKLPSTNELHIPTFLDFARVHNNEINSDAAHGFDDGPFLHWHRWFIWKFEQALQLASGTCVTLPYWDWSIDADDAHHATVLQSDTFGSTAGIDSTDGCVTDGIVSKYGFWTTTANGDPCLKR